MTEEEDDASMPPRTNMKTEMGAISHTGNDESAEFGENIDSEYGDYFRYLHKAMYDHQHFIQTGFTQLRIEQKEMLEACIQLSQIIFSTKSEHSSEFIQHTQSTNTGQETNTMKHTRGKESNKNRPVEIKRDKIKRRTNKSASCSGIEVKSLDLLSDEEILQLVTRSNIRIEKEKHVGGNTNLKHILESVKQVIGAQSSSWQLVDRSIAAHEGGSRMRAGKGMDTILCVNNTVRGGQFHDVQKTAIDFITGLEESVEKHGIEENIAIVSLGPRAGILHHLTNDFGSLIDSVENMEESDPYESMLEEGLLMCIAAALRGGVCQLGCLRLPARLIIVTDGSLTQGVDVMDRDPVNYIIKLFGSKQMKDDVFNAVVILPVGDTLRTDFASFLVLCKGSLSSGIGLAHNFQKLKRLAAKIAGVLKGKKDVQSEDIDRVVSLATHYCSLPEKCHVSDIVRDKLRVAGSYLGATNIMDNVHVLPNGLALGSRVIRGPDWRWGEQDYKGVGTVINHGGHQGSVWVMWDSGMKNVYRYGHRGLCDLLPVNRPARRVKYGTSVQIGTMLRKGTRKGTDTEDTCGVVLRKSNDKILVVRPDETISIHSIKDITTKGYPIQFWLT